jgi:hypothetical protein
MPHVLKSGEVGGGSRNRWWRGRGGLSRAMGRGARRDSKAFSVRDGSRPDVMGGRLNFDKQAKTRGAAWQERSAQLGVPSLMLGRRAGAYVGGLKAKLCCRERFMPWGHALGKHAMESRMT